MNCSLFFIAYLQLKLFNFKLKPGNHRFLFSVCLIGVLEFQV